jgi:hypothetical protein
MSEEENKPETTPENKFSIGQTRRIGIIYESIAKMLPTEGRDYSIEFTPGEGDTIKIRFSAKTELGVYWSNYLQKNLQSVITASTCGANKACKLNQQSQQSQQPQQQQ